MTWSQKADIAKGVVDLLRVNMNFKAGEKLVVVSDVPRLVDWHQAKQGELTEALERVVLARQICEIAQEHYPETTTEFVPFIATGGHGTEPDAETAARMSDADVLLCLTSYSLSHTDARQNATNSGVRVASMPGFTHSMLAPGGPMAVDYNQVAADCRRFADLLTAADEAIVRTSYGTDLRFSLAGRPGEGDDGLYGHDADRWGNLPAGESFAIPLEGSGEGTLVAPANWYPDLTENMVFTFEKGVVVALTGGGDVGDHFREMLDLGSDNPQNQARRNLAELGIGTNPNARQPDNVLEAEKIMGTVHVAIGDNIHMGGKVEADLHEDFVQPDADLYLNGQLVMTGGKWV